MRARAVRVRSGSVLYLSALVALLAAAGSPGFAQSQDAALRAVVPAAAQQPAAAPKSPPAPADTQPQPADAASKITQPAPAAPNPAAPPPAAPDPAALKAAAVLDTHCARCHQRGKLEGGIPSGGLANITRLPELARDEALVQPGFPDASRLYLELLERRMPPDVYREGAKAPEPTEDEIQKVRDWIAGLPPRTAACQGRAFISPAEVAGAIRAVLDADAEAAKTTRFLTLTHLYNSCASESELDAYRQAAAKLMNSLAWSLDPARLEPIDAARTILRIKLPELGWIGAHWEKLARAFPAVSAPALRLPAELNEKAATSRPALPADWVASAALRPAFYADLLGLPAELDDLKRILTLDTEETIKAGTAVRMAITQSQVTPAHRLFEVHPLATGGKLWLSYDFASTSGEQDIFQRPFGPADAEGVAKPFQHDALRVMFNLPNGFLAYAVHDADGRRLDFVPAALEKLEAVGHAASASGGSCISCHSAGPVAVKDELRSRLQQDPQANKPTLIALQPVLRGEGELKTLFEDEAYRFRRALIRAGVDPDLWIGGLEPVAALKRRHEVDVSLARAAAEFGMPQLEFRARLAAHTGAVADLARRLQQGMLPRPEIAQLFAGLLGEQAPPAPAQQAAPQAQKPPGEEGGQQAADAAASQSLPRKALMLTAARSTFRVGDTVAFTARSSVPCRLTLISVDKAGKAIVLFPNEFEQDNLLKPEQPITVPTAAAPYHLRLKEKGAETLIGVCTLNARIADGIQPDYEKQRFTILGNWRNFLSAALAEETAERRNPEEAKEKDKRRRRRGRARGESDEQPPRPVGPEPQVRAAIRYTVE